MGTQKCICDYWLFVCLLPLLVAVYFLTFIIDVLILALGISMQEMWVMPLTNRFTKLVFGVQFISESDIEHPKEKGTSVVAVLPSWVRWVIISVVLVLAFGVVCFCIWLLNS